jgi:NAD(P)-dependent dehydrogenase (short-subunit alcohol dehydrogenase family)
MALAGRHVLVTGGSSGLGRAVAARVADLGAVVTLVARRRDALEDAAAALAGEGHRVAPFDLSDLDGIADLVANVARNRPLDGLVHAAGVQITLPIGNTSIADMEALMRVNYGAAFALARAFRRRTMHTDNAAIVFLASVMATVGTPAVSAYAASKGALVALARSLAVELSPSIRVNCVAPGMVETPMLEALRARLTTKQFEELDRMHLLGIGHPIDVANAVAFLLGDTGRWITGTTLVVDGGYTAH